jgi:hypothetical protein
VVTLASATIRGIARVNVPIIDEWEVDNPVNGAVPLQVVFLTPTYTLPASASTDTYQVLSDGQVAVQAELAALGTGQIDINHVLANQYPLSQAIEVTEDTDTFTMSNEYYTVTLRKTMNIVSPQTPVASITMASGVVELTGSDHRPEWTAYFGASYTPTVTGYTFEVIEQGPLVVKVKATYSLSHSGYYGFATEVFPPNSNAFASETIELRAGVDAVFFENDSDYYWVSGFDIAGLDVDQIKYRNNSASTQANGYLVDGGAVTRTYNVNSYESYTATKDLTEALTFSDYTNNPFVVVWDPYKQNAGRFVIARDSSGAADHYVSVLGGGASRALGNAFSGAKFTGWGTSTKIIFAAQGRSPSGSLFSRIRYPWALHIGSEPAPATNSTTVPGAGLFQNRHITTALSKLFNWIPSSDSETFYTEALYMSAEQQAGILARIDTDPTYAENLSDRDETSRDLIDYLENPTLAGAEALYDEIMELRRAMLDSYWNYNGIRQLVYHYWQGALAVNRIMPQASLLMQDTSLSAGQKADIYKTMLFFGFLLADQDFTPIRNDDLAQFSLGNPNQPVQYSSQTDSLHIFLLSNPRIASFFDTNAFVARQTERIEGIISAYGSPKESPHYLSPGVEPILNLCQQYQVGGLTDFTVTIPRLALFAQFMLDLLTPEDSRFGDLRKMICFGDGSLEGSSMHGQLGTLFAASNPTLSAKLMDAWFSMDWPHNGFYQYSFLKIDDTLPTASMTLSDAHYPDYMSVLRSGFGTANESSVWFLHGEWFSDHRHYDEGSISCYMLGAPISLDWSSFGTPAIPGSILHSGLTLVADISWDGTGGLVPCENAGGADYDIIQGQNRHNVSSVTYTPSSTRPSTLATFDLGSSTTWTRTVTLNKEEVARPVLVIEDAFAGTNAANEKIVALNLMMTGAVTTPDGDTTPTTTANRATSTDKTALASGWTTFEFTGQWGVNLILMVYNVASANYQLGRFSHTYSPTIEKNQYLAAVGSSYVEMQYQFRLWSTDDSIFVLVPWLDSGSKPTVTTSGMDVLVDGDTVT